MRKLFTLLPVASFAIDYPIETDKTLTIWRVLDGSIAGGGYTTSNDTPGFKAWQEGSGIKAEIREFADNNALLLALNGGTELPDIIQITANNYKGNVMGMVNDELIIEITPEMFEAYAPDFWAFASPTPCTWTSCSSSTARFTVPAPSSLRSIPSIATGAASSIVKTF